MNIKQDGVAEALCFSIAFIVVIAGTMIILISELIEYLISRKKKDEVKKIDSIQNSSKR